MIQIILPLYLNLSHIYIFVSLLTFWTYYTAVYGLTLFFNTVFHNKLFLEHIMNITINIKKMYYLLWPQEKRYVNLVLANLATV